MGGDENQNLFKINAVKMSVIEEVNTEETLPGVLEFLDALIHESQMLFDGRFLLSWQIERYIQVI